jgi:hypothetical protein
MSRHKSERDTRRTKIGLAVAMLVIVAATPGTEGCGKTEPTIGQSEVTSAPAVVPAAAQPPTTPTSTSHVEKSRIAVASFKGEHLQECMLVAVTIGRPLGNRADGKAEPWASLTAEQFALLLLDDGLTAVQNGSSVLRAGGKETLTKNMASFADGKTDEEKAAITETIKQLEGDAIAEQFKKDGLLRVENCEFPGRMPLGTCLIEDSVKTESSIELAWAISRFHYDVSSTADSDAGMKSCLTLGGNWVAPAQDDPAAAHERVRQRTRQLRGLLDER